VYHAKHRQYRASVYLAELPKHCEPDEGCSCLEIVRRAPVISGAPGTYDKGVSAIVQIPDSCDYWIDDQKLVILGRRDKLCGSCHHLLQRYEEADICEHCWRIYPK